MGGEPCRSFFSIAKDKKGERTAIIIFAKKF